MIHYYTIGDFHFSIEGPDDIFVNENIKLFYSRNERADYHYTITIDDLPPCVGDIIHQSSSITIYQNSDLESREIKMIGDPNVCSVYQEVDDSHAVVTVAPAYIDSLSMDTFFLSLLSLEKRMLDRGGLILHSAYMAHNDKAVLFSAPSGTGKSTQAKLWEQYRGTYQVNGDRSLLQKVNGKWYAKGWPVCGSSMICHNEEHEIEAIVMLSQAKENTIERLSSLKAFSQTYSQITINRWNVDAAKKAMALIDDLVMSVPVYHLSCTISLEAVETLEKELCQPNA